MRNLDFLLRELFWRDNFYFQIKLVVVQVTSQTTKNKNKKCVDMCANLTANETIKRLIVKHWLEVSSTT